MKSTKKAAKAPAFSKPAARLRLNLIETIMSKIAVPTVTFSSVNVAGTDKPVVTMIFGLDAIGKIADSEVANGEETTWVDALINGTNYLSPGHATIKVEPMDIKGGARITIQADVNTKIPGTGSRLRRSKK